ncbi:MAG: hypothetical protein KDA80_12790, partial [Planctomycetaceae bacterium]|nr:hypothetical protein [Planctomycetaceae bacterium]
MSRSLILVGQIATFTAVSVVPLWGLAQEQRPPVRVANQPDADGANQQRPPAIQPQIQTPKEMEPFLQTWEQQSSKIDRIEGTFKKYEYDFVFKTEKRADGRYWFEKPDKGRMDFSPEKNVPEAPNNVHKVGNTEFTIEADAARSWICTGEVILDVDIPNKTYNEIQIPKHFQGEQISEGPLPFLFGMKAARMKQR